MPSIIIIGVGARRVFFRSLQLANELRTEFNVVTFIKSLYVHINILLTGWTHFCRTVSFAEHYKHYTSLYLIYCITLRATWLFVLNNTPKILLSTRSVAFKQTELKSSRDNNHTYSTIIMVYPIDINQS